MEKQNDEYFFDKGKGGGGYLFQEYRHFQLLRCISWLKDFKDFFRIRMN